MLSAILVGLLVLGVMLAGCGGGTASEGEPSAAAQATGGTVAGGDSSSSAGPSAEPSATAPSEVRTEATATSSETRGGTGAGSASVEATSEPAQSTREAAARVAEEEESEYEIHYVIARDQIPAILDPQFLDAGEAIEAYNEHEQVLGLSIDGDHRAYPIPFLSQHEIVNDVVGGKPVAVTW